MVKRIFWLCFMLFMVILGSITGFAKDEKVVVNFWTYPRWAGINGAEPDGKVGDWQREAAKRFMQKHPNVTINIDMLNFSGGPEKVSVALASGTKPDIIEDYPGRIFEYARMGYILPLDRYLNKEYTGDYLENIWAQSTLGDGKHYYLPWGISPQVMMVNKTLFKKAGAENLLPANKERTWTRDEYLKALKAVMAKVPGVYGVGLFADTSSGDSFFLNWIWSGGVNTFNKTYTKIALNNKKGIAGLKFLKMLLDEKIAAPGAAGLKASDVITLFNQQKVLTVPVATINYARTVKGMADGNIADFEVECVMIPHAVGEKPVTFVHPYGFAVFKNKKASVQKWAVEFAKFLGDKDHAAAVKAAGSFSPRKSQARLYKDLGDSNIDFAATILGCAIDAGLQTPGFNQVRTNMAMHIQAVYTGIKTPEQALKDFEREGNKIIVATKKAIKQ
jgi:multiple sugar transport system substrate-binding protein